MIEISLDENNDPVITISTKMTEREILNRLETIETEIQEKLNEHIGKKNNEETRKLIKKEILEIMLKNKELMQDVFILQLF